MSTANTDEKVVTITRVELEKVLVEVGKGDPVKDRDDIDAICEAIGFERKASRIKIEFIPLKQASLRYHKESGMYLYWENFPPEDELDDWEQVFDSVGVPILSQPALFVKREV